MTEDPTVLDENDIFADLDHLMRGDILFTRLAGNFNLRAELLSALATAEHPDAIRTEIMALEEVMGRVIVFLGGWNGVDSVASKLLFRGVIATRGDVHRLVAPIFDNMDTEQFPPVDVPMIGVAGQIASGKGSVGDIIADKYRSMHLPLSDRLREVAASHELTPSPDRSTLRKINDELKPRFGNPVFVRWTIEMAKRLASVYKKSAMTFDGFRTVDEAQLFKDRGGKLIAISASPDTRYRRLVERQRGLDDFERSKFNESDAIEQAWINPVLALADVVIENEGTFDELQAAVLAYCGQILPQSAMQK